MGMASTLRMPIILALMFGSSQLHLDEEPKLTYLRVAFAVAQAICLLCSAYAYLRIKAAKDETEIEVTTPAAFGVEAKKVTQTHQEYDMAELSKFVKQIVIGTAIVGFIHYKWGGPQPLLFQAVLNPISLLDNSLFHIHILGHPADGAHKRPFKEENPFAKLQETIKGGDINGAKPKDD